MNKKIILFTMATVTALVTLDTTIVGVALPSIARSLHATFADLEWVIGGYVLCFASLLTPIGLLGDQRGRRRAVLVGVSIFGAASLLCGLAQSAALLTIARVLQGVGAAFLPPAALGIIGHTFRGNDRVRAFGVWGAVLGLAIIAGPIVGGIVTSQLGWRWTFLINIPICCGLLFAIARWVPDSRDPNAKHYDIVGCVTFASALFLVTWSLIDPHYVAVRLLGAAIMLVVFVTVERRHPYPMLDLSLFGRPAFLGAVAAGIGYAAAAQVLIFFFPLYLQNAFGYSAQASGLAMLPFAIPLFIMPRIGARASARYGSRVVLATGLGLVAGGDLLLAWSAPLLHYAVFATAMVVTGAGAGMLNGETALALQSTIPTDRGSMAGGLAATIRFTSILLAVAVFGVVLSHAATIDITRRAEEATLAINAAPFARRGIAGDLAGALLTMPQSARLISAEIARLGVASGIAWLMLTAAAIAAGSGALVWRLLPATTYAERVGAAALVVD
ncbi:MAG TPA: MFS transporter [Gemmatimonadaceae bacterium]|nr:MFS transporter [Gemmatimonadaceae bacterium]